MTDSRPSFSLEDPLGTRFTFFINKMNITIVLCSVFRKETVMWNYGKMPAVNLKSFKKVNGYGILQLPLES